MSTLLRRDEPNGVTWLTLNRPERLNSFTASDYRDLRVALTDCQSDEDVRVVVLTGTGRAFSVGADRSLLDNHDRDEVTSQAGTEFFALLDALANLDKPLIAAVNGLGIGFGCTAILYADVVLVAATARLRMPFTALGIVPEAGSTALLAARMRSADAMWAVLTSEWIDSDTAVASGLAWRSVDDDALPAAASDLASNIATLDPAAVAATKRLMVAGRAEAARSAIERELAAMTALSDDRRGGLEPIHHEGSRSRSMTSGSSTEDRANDAAPLIIERHGPVLLLRINRPDARNALTFGLMAGIGHAVVEAEADPETRVVVLTGTGDRAFCAGMDLAEFASGAEVPAEMRDGMNRFQRLMTRDLTIPLVGAANATAMAGGLELLLGCDIIVASDHAQFGLPEVKRGLLAAGGGCFIGTRIPLGAALEITLTGNQFTAQRAYEIGLVNAVVGADEVLETAMRFAQAIAENAPLSVSMTKKLVSLTASDPEQAKERLKELRPIIWSSDDAKEGAIAFMEKRPPVWTGR